MPEPRFFNINFEAIGIETTLLITNIGSVIWNTYAGLFFALLTLCLFKVTSVWEKVGKKFFFNGMVRFTMIHYQEYVLLSILNIAMIDYGSPYESERYSNTISIIFFILSLILPPILIILTTLYFNQWLNREFRKRFGSLLEGINTTKHGR